MLMKSYYILGRLSRWLLKDNYEVNSLLRYLCLLPSQGNAGLALTQKSWYVHFQENNFHIKRKKLGQCCPEKNSAGCWVIIRPKLWEFLKVVDQYHVEGISLIWPSLSMSQWHIMTHCDTWGPVIGFTQPPPYPFMGLLVCIRGSIMDSNWSSGPFCV